MKNKFFIIFLIPCTLQAVEKNNNQSNTIKPQQIIIKIHNNPVVDVQNESKLVQDIKNSASPHVTAIDMGDQSMKTTEENKSSSEWTNMVMSSAMLILRYGYFLILRTGTW